MVHEVAQSQVLEKSDPPAIGMVGGIAATIIYTFLAAASALWVVWVQNTGVNVSIEEITNSDNQPPF